MLDQLKDNAKDTRLHNASALFDNVALFENGDIAQAYQLLHENAYFALGMTTKTAYQSQPVEVLEMYLKRTQMGDTTAITTCAQETLSNAILWNNLAIDKENLLDDRSNLCELIDQKLAKPHLAKLPVVLTFSADDHFYKVSLITFQQIVPWNQIFKSQQGKPHKGMSIIQSLCHHIETSDQEGRITLSFEADHFLPSGAVIS